MPEALQNISIWTIQCRLQAILSCSHETAVNPENEEEKSGICEKLQTLDLGVVGKVMFNDESTFRPLRMVHKRIRRPIDLY